MSIKKAKKKTKTAQQLKTEFKKVFNRYVRRRDTQPNGYGACCSCGKVFSFEGLEAGHYIHNCSALRYDERNVHAQCGGCNKWKHGNSTGYALFLVREYGPLILEEFHDARTTRKIWRRNELLELLDIYRKKLKDMEINL